MPTSLTYIVLSARGCSPWRPDAVVSTDGGRSQFALPDFQGPPRAHRGPPRRRTYAELEPYRRLRRFQGTGARLTREENPRRGSRRRLRADRRSSPPGPAARSENFNSVPFRCRRILERLHDGVVQSLRTDLPMFKCCSHGTFLHVGLQSEVSFEYLLLPPRSALGHATESLAAPLRALVPHALLLIGAI